MVFHMKNEPLEGWYCSRILSHPMCGNVFFVQLQTCTEFGIWRRRARYCDIPRLHYKRIKIWDSSINWSRLLLRAANKTYGIVTESPNGASGKFFLSKEGHHNRNEVSSTLKWSHLRPLQNKDIIPLFEETVKLGLGIAEEADEFGDLGSPSSSDGCADGGDEGRCGGYGGGGCGICGCWSVSGSASNDASTTNGCTNQNDCGSLAWSKFKGPKKDTPMNPQTM